MEHGLGLTTITALLAIITTLSLGEQRCLSGLVLCDLVLGVLLAVPALAIGSSGLWYVDLEVVLLAEILRSSVRRPESQISVRFPSECDVDERAENCEFR